MSALHARSAATCLALEAILCTLADELATEAIEFRVLKGPAVGRLDHRNVDERAFGDIDVLVRADDFARTARVLEPRRGMPPLRGAQTGLRPSLRQGAAFKMPGGYEIDLHRTIVAGPFGLTIDLDPLFAPSEVFQLAGRELRALGREERFLHACVHAVLGTQPPRLSALRDVAVLGLDPRLDDALVARRCLEWQLEAVVADAVRQTWRTLGLCSTSPTVDRALALRPSPRQRRRLALYQDTAHGSAPRALGALGAVSGWRNKLAYGRAIALPKRSPGRRPLHQRWRRGIDTAVARLSPRRSRSRPRPGR